MTTDTLESTHQPFANRVAEYGFGAGRAWVLPTPVRSVVSMKGSFRTNPDFAAGEELLQRLTVSLLDKGTRHRDRFAVAELLEDRGAQLHFYDDGLRCGFTGRALREHLEDVVALLAEQLREPLFDPDELEKARARVAASIQRSLESTGQQASAALSRRLFGPDHPNHSPPPETELERLAAYTIDDVRDFHARHFGAVDLHVALAGDVEAVEAGRLFEQGLGDWSAHGAPPAFEAGASAEVPGRIEVPMPDRQNIDVRLGHAIGVRRQDEAFVPLYVANYILGGNFSARLMAIVRDEMGLTYGIRSRLSGISTEYDGHWGVAVTLSGENVERGVEATLGVVRDFVDGGATEEELRDKKTTITGSFRVGLATTGGLAHALLANAERGFGPGYLDRFPEEVDAVGLDEMNALVRRHLAPDAFHTALAGTLADAHAV